MAGFFNYDKPGKGVEKEEFVPNLSTFFRIFIDGFWKLMQLNMVHFIFSAPLMAVLFWVMPVGSASDENYVSNLFRLCFFGLLILSVVGIPPLMTGLTYVLRNYATDRHSWVFSDYFEHIRRNIRQSALLLIIDVAFGIIVPTAFYFYSSVIGVEGAAPHMKSLAFFARAFLTAAAAVYFMMHFYIYQMMVTFRLGLKQILKNALIFTFSHIFRSLGILLLITALAAVGMGINIGVGLVTAIVILPVLIGFIVNFIVSPVIARHMLTEEQ